MKRFALYALALFGVALYAAPLFAQTATATPATSINLGWFADFAQSYIVPTLGAIVALGLGKLYLVLKAKWGIDIDAGQRDALQSALTNAAGLLIAKGVHAVDGKTIEVGNPLIAQAVKYVQDAAPGAMSHFGLGPDDVAQKIVAKIGALGAAPVTEAPAAVPAAVPAAALAPAAG